MKKHKRKKYCDVCAEYWVVDRYETFEGHKYPVDKEGFDHDHNKGGSDGGTWG